MGITISGENNNDRILASDGVIDQLSGFNVVGVMTATSFTGDLTGDVTGNLTGNVTGNINNSTLLLQTGGSERLRITSLGKIGIDNASPDNKLSVYDVGYCGLELKSNRSTATDNIGGVHWKTQSTDVAYLQSLVDGTIRFRNTSSLTERLRIDSSGRIIKGHTATYPVAGHYPSVQLTGTTFNDATLSIINNVNDSTGSYILLSKQRSGSQGGATIVQDDDLVGQIMFTAGDGTDLTSRIAEIKGMVDGTPGSNDTPGRLSFWTTADGAQSSTERLRITSAGNVGINVTPEASSILHIKKPTGAKVTIESNDSNHSYINFSAASNEMSAGFDKPNDRFTISNNDGLSSNQRVVIKSGGNVGLGGETNPITTLSINRGDTGANTSFLNAELIRIDGYGSTNSKSGIGFGRYNSGQNGSIPAAFIGAQTGTWSSSTNCHLIFATRDSTGNVEPTERLRITSDGNVVVGGSSLGASGSFGMEPNGHVRSVLASGNAGDSLLGAISGVSNGFQINIDSSNNQTYKFHNGSTLSMQIDSGGRVTTPLRPAWHAWGANSWTSYSGSNNLVTFAYSDTNIGSHYKTSGSDAGKFVCPVAGVYFFYCTIYSGRSDNSTSDGSDYMAINFFSSTNNLANKGGHHIAHYYNEGDRDSTRTLSYVKYCSAGEKLYVTVSCNGTSFQIYGGHSAFGGYLLG